MNERRLFTITQVRREDGVWRARVTVNGHGIDVDREHGSWMTTPDVPGGSRKDLLSDVAAALQDKVRPIENAERICREKITRLDPKKDTEAIAELNDELAVLDARARGQIELRSEPKEAVSFTPAANPFLAGVPGH